MDWLKEQWRKLSLKNRKRIVSFLNTFVSTFLTLLGAQLALGFPPSWAALGALLLAVLRTSFREALNVVFVKDDV